MKIGVVWGGLWLKNTKTLNLHPLQWELQRKLWNSARRAQRDESSSSSTHTKSQMCWHGRLTPALGRHRQFTVQASLAQSMSHRSQGDGPSQQIRWMASFGTAPKFDLWPLYAPIPLHSNVCQPWRPDHLKTVTPPGLRSLNI